MYSTSADASTNTKNLPAHKNYIKTIVIFLIGKGKMDRHPHLTTAAKTLLADSLTHAGKENFKTPAGLSRLHARYFPEDNYTNSSSSSDEEEEFTSSEKDD